MATTLMLRSLSDTVSAIGIVLALASIPVGAQSTLESLKTAAEQARGGHQAHLYAEIAGALVDRASDEFAQGHFEQGHATVQEAVQYGVKASDQAIASRHKMKEVEIQLRFSQRHVEAIKRTLPAADRPQLDDAGSKLADLRQKLLNAMFAKPKKKPEESK
jgi:predicted DNA binding CopG/RHH family protein